MNELEKIASIVRGVIGMIIQLVGAVFVLAVLFNLFHTTADFNVIKNLSGIINSFLGGGFTGLIALVVFVHFLTLSSSKKE